MFKSDDESVVTTTADNEFPGWNVIEMWGISNIPPGMARFGKMKMPPIKELLAHQEKIDNKLEWK